MPVTEPSRAVFLSYAGMLPADLNRRGRDAVRWPRYLRWSMVVALTWCALESSASRAVESQPPQGLYLPGLMVTADVDPVL